MEDPFNIRTRMSNLPKSISKELFRTYNCIEAFVIFHLFFSVSFTKESLEQLNQYICHNDNNLHHPYFIWQVIILPVNSICATLGQLLVSKQLTGEKKTRALHIYRTSFTQMYLQILIKYYNSNSDYYEGKKNS